MGSRSLLPSTSSPRGCAKLQRNCWTHSGPLRTGLTRKFSPRATRFKQPFEPQSPRQPRSNPTGGQYDLRAGRCPQPRDRPDRSATRGRRPSLGSTVAGSHAAGDVSSRSMGDNRDATKFSTLARFQLSLFSFWRNKAAHDESDVHFLLVPFIRFLQRVHGMRDIKPWRMTAFPVAFRPEKAQDADIVDGVRAGLFVFWEIEIDLVVNARILFRLNIFYGQNEMPLLIASFLHSIVNFTGQ